MKQIRANTTSQELALTPRIGSRRWTAWKLVQIAAHIFDADYYQRITVKDSEGNAVVEYMIVADLYGCGVSSCYGNHGQTFGDGYTVELDEYALPPWRLR